ncbi:unnamed protein product [Staurois parvus]|uniref:Uncharacterized protein n=1 Tax=Staurois parvus TaxID=386267 RepID=A0ABN9GBC8_9NEOB|nr:unnamed protein product [Staurois parvus]
MMTSVMSVKTVGRPLYDMII